MRDFQPEQPVIPAFFSSIKFFKIPKYQRPYTWSEDRIQDLWEDLLSNQSGHYLGVVVLKIDRQGGRYDVIDGQQRLITLTTFIALLRNLFLIEGDTQTANNLQKLIIREGYKNTGPVILAGTHLNEFFEKYIQSFENNVHSEILDNNISIALNEESEQLAKNYRRFYKEISSSEEWLKSPRKFLNRIKDTLDNTQILSLTVENEDDAFALFETLNYKLARLSEIDLIKNRIFMTLTEERSESDVEKDWDELVLNIGGEKRDLTQLDTYLKYFWWSRYGKLPPSRIFKELRSHNISTIFDDLLKDSHYYSPLVRPPSEKLIINNRDLSEIRAVSRWLNLKQVNIVLLSLIRIISRDDFNAFSTPKINALLKFLPKFVIAYKFSKRSPSNVERIYSKYAIKIFEATNRTQFDQALTDFMRDLKAETPNKEEFYESFDLKYRPNDSFNNNLIAYLFERIMFPDDELQLKETDIEHVFPQRPDNGFAASEQKIRERIHELGNLSPLGRVINQQECINLRPVNKVDIYKKSKIPMVAEVTKIIKEQGWSAEIIEWRTKDQRERIREYLNS